MVNYKIIANQSITPSTQLLTLQYVQGERLVFRAGQYAAINGYKGRRAMPIRCFSIVTSPTDTDFLQFSMRVKGHFTKAVASLPVGDMVHVQGPYGGFVINRHDNSKVVYLAGGIGITPFISMIRLATITRSTTDMRLVYSAQSQDDIPFLDILKWHDGQNPSFTPTFVVSKGPRDKLDGYASAEGRITSEVLESIVGVTYADVDTIFYVCGPPPFMNGMLHLLQSKGISRSRINTEAFSQGRNRQTGLVRDWPFSMYGLTALGTVAALLAITTGDFIRTVPRLTTTKHSLSLGGSSTANQRQSDIDALINSLPARGAGSQSSPGVQSAVAAATPPTTTVSPITGLAILPTSQSTITPGSKTATSGAATPVATSTSTAAPATPPAPAPTPAPKPAPVCTTSQSGVTTCK
ncbi:MAG: FAD-binding oxidoreductase [Candidatus Saccharibacteria bacterium]